MKTKIPLFSILFFIAVLGNFFVGSYLHEDIHRQIFRDYGVESEIGFNLISGYTKPVENYTGLSREEIRNMNKLHIQNEIVTYNLQQYYSLIAIGFFIIILILEMKNDN